MPNIELMKIMTTMGLGQNISFDLYLQNYEQLEEIYGKTDCRNDQRELWKSLLSADKLRGNLKKFLEYAR